MLQEWLETLPQGIRKKEALIAIQNCLDIFYHTGNVAWMTSANVIQKEALSRCT